MVVTESWTDAQTNQWHKLKSWWGITSLKYNWFRYKLQRNLVIRIWTKVTDIILSDCITGTITNWKLKHPLDYIHDTFCQNQVI